MSVWIFQIPPLKTKTPLFDVEVILPELAPILTFQYPEDVEDDSFRCQKHDEWYYSDLSSPPLYFDMFEGPQNKFSRYKLDVASDLSSLSVTHIGSTPLRHNIRPAYHSIAYRICEDSSVNISDNGSWTSSSAFTVGVGLSSEYHRSQPPALHLNMTLFAFAYIPRSFCPASARFVYINSLGDIAISDFL